MIGFHFQGNSNDWPDAVAKLPPGAPVKVVDGVQRCPEAKGVNPDVYTVVRHHVDEQNPGGDQHQIARDFFASFVDGSFRQIAWSVDAVQEWNEYFSNSQGQVERDTWINMARAFVDVWRDDYRTQADYAHIELILAETAVGNDIPMELAALSHQYDWVVLGYHPYVPVYRGEMRPDHWRWYSGRWSFMDDNYIANGYRVRWFFGEFGAVGHNGPGWPNSLAPNDGWKDDDVYNGSLPDYVDMMRAWMTEATKTRAWKEGRVRGGATIFTSGGGSSWRKFEVAQPDMNVIAQAVNDFMTNIPDVDPPPPPPPPPPATDDGLPRVQYKRRVNVAHQGATLAEWLSMCEAAYNEKQSCGFSYDDAGIGALDSKTAVLYGLADDSAQVIFANWYAANYPGTVVEFRDYTAPQFPIVDVVNSLPRHDTKHYNLRAYDAIETLIIHHTVTPPTFTTEAIAQYHVSEHDWPGIGYHYVIGADGLIEQVNYDSTKSYHATAANPYSIGIALKGDFTFEHPPAEQLAALQWLVIKLKADYNIIEVVGHRDAEGASTGCPGNTWQEWMPT